MGRLVVFGAGGCGGDLLRAALHCYSDVVYADDAKAGGEFLGRPIIHPDQMRDSDHFTPASGNGVVRAQMIDRLSGFKLATIIAPTAVIGPGVDIGAGAQIHDFAMITSNAVIGRCCQINIRASVGHDVTIEDFVTIGPHCVVGAYSTVGARTVMGIGCTVRPDGRKPVLIGEGAMIGCGSTVMSSVSDNAKVAGNPARPLREYLRAV